MPNAPAIPASSVAVRMRELAAAKERLKSLKARTVVTKWDRDEDEEEEGAVAAPKRQRPS